MDLVAAHYQELPAADQVVVVNALDTSGKIDEQLNAWSKSKGSGSMPVLVILEAQLLSMERRAALLWRADRAGVLVVLVVPYLSPDDTRLQLKSLSFVATIIQCLPSEALFISALKSIPKEGDRHQRIIKEFRALRLVFGSSLSLGYWARSRALESLTVTKEELACLRAAADGFFDDKVMS